VADIGAKRFLVPGRGTVFSHQDQDSQNRILGFYYREFSWSRRFAGTFAAKSAPVSLCVAGIFALSLGLAISSAFFFPAKTPTTSQRQVVAIPALLEAKLVGTDGSAAGQQTSPITPPPPEELKSVVDKLSDGQRSGPPRGFRNLAWSSPPTTTMIKVGGPFGPRQVSIWRDRSKNLNPAFGASVTEENYFFYGGDLYGGELIFDGLDNFQKVRAGLTEVFGPPNFADENNQVFKWQWQNPEIELRISYQKMSHRSELHLERKQQPGAERAVQSRRRG
jgi:hypothetical protein